MINILKNKKIKLSFSFSFFSLLVILFIAIIIYLILKPGFNFLNKNKDKKTITTPKKCPEQNIEYYNYMEIKLENITEKEAEKYKNIVRQFERYQKNEDANSLIKMFSPPENKSEKSELEFIAGYDLENTPRLYMVRLHNYSLNWFLFKSIKKEQNGNIIVEVLESRTSPEFKEESLVEYEPFASKDMILVFEILPDKKIKKYYPRDSKTNGKYDGFYAN